MAWLGNSYSYVIVGRLTIGFADMIRNDIGSLASVRAWLGIWLFCEVLDWLVVVVAGEGSGW